MGAYRSDLCVQNEHHGATPFSDPPPKQQEFPEGQGGPSPDAVHLSLSPRGPGSSDPKGVPSPAVKYERIKFLVIALKSSVEVYAWAPKPYHKFMAFKVLGRGSSGDGGPQPSSLCPPAAGVSSPSPFLPCTCPTVLR